MPQKIEKGVENAKKSNFRANSIKFGQNKKFITKPQKSKQNNTKKIKKGLRAENKSPDLKSGYSRLNDCE